MTHFYIRRDVYFASAGNAVVFLDLRYDQYSMLVGDKAKLFHSMMAQTTEPVAELSIPAVGAHDKMSHSVRELLTELQDAHALTDLRHDAAQTGANIDLPTEDLADVPTADMCKIRLRDICRFVASCVVTTWQLKFASIESTVGSLRRRKLLRHRTRASDVGELRRLTMLHRRLRPFFPRDFVCLFDSLSLIEFLAAYRYFPDLIFAVRLDPWYAHCWVQYGTLALNQDSLEVSAYIPIMAA